MHFYVYNGAILFLSESILKTYSYSFEIITGTYLITSSAVTFSLHGNPVLIPGLYHKALYLNGLQQYFTSPLSQHGCLNNINLCQSGFTIALWINFQALKEDTYIVSNGGNLNTVGFSFYYVSGQLKFGVTTSGKVWKAMTDKNQYHVDLQSWHHYHLSWSPKTGAHIFIDGILHGIDDRPDFTHGEVLPSGELYFGYMNNIGNTIVVNYANMFIEGYKEWYTDINALKNIGIVARKYKCRYLAF